jgi:hypothetical protein
MVADATRSDASLRLMIRITTGHVKDVRRGNCFVISRHITAEEKSLGTCDDCSSWAQLWIMIASNPFRQSSSTSTTAPARNLNYQPEDAILARQDDGPVSPLPITDDFQVSRYHFLAPSGPGVSNIRETHPSQGHRLSLRQMVDQSDRSNQYDHQPAHSPVESLLGGGHRGGESQGAGNPVEQGIITETEAVSLYSL